MGRSQARSRPKRALVSLTVLAVLAATCTLTVTDLAGRAEVHGTDSEIARAEALLDRASTQLAATKARADDVGMQARDVAALVLAAQATIDSTEASISKTEQGISVDGVDISELDRCLGGVVQALDQVTVGQVQGALSSLEAVSGSCSAARPSGG